MNFPTGLVLRGSYKGFEDLQEEEQRERKRREGNCINFDLDVVFRLKQSPVVL